MLVSVSDTDMLPSAYKDGDLGPAVGPDMLSVIRLDRAEDKYRAVESPVSNSVAGPPSSVAVTPDGRFAVVIETLGGRSAATKRLDELAKGRTITLVDLSPATGPRLVQRVQGFEMPLAVAIDPTGSLVAVTHAGGSDSPPLALYRLTNGALSKAIVPDLPAAVGKQGLLGVVFHPSEPVLALLDAEGSQLSFVKYDTAAANFAVEPWGNTIATEKAPFLVRFTPDGRHALVNGSYAAFNFNLAFSSAPRGSVSSYRIAASRAPDGQPQHRFVDRAFTGVVPEGMDVSPDGKFIVTANLERSAPRPGSDDMTRFSSMTLIQMNPETGRLKRINDFAFDGALPESVLFDNASRFVAVTVYNQFDDLRAPGSIDFWRLETDPFDPDRIELVKTRHSIPVARGPHSMAIVR